MTYRDNMPTERRSWKDWVPRTPADQKLKTMVDDIRSDIQAEPSIARAMADFGIEHFTVKSFSTGSAVEFLNSASEHKLVVIPNGTTIKQIKDILIPLNPARYVQRPRVEDTARPETLAKLRAMVQADAKAASDQPTDIIARIERIERKLGL